MTSAVPGVSVSTSNPRWTRLLEASRRVRTNLEGQIEAAKTPEQIAALRTAQREGVRAAMGWNSPLKLLGQLHPMDSNSPVAIANRADTERRREQAVADVRAAMDFLAPGDEAALQQALARLDKRLLKVTA